MYQPGRVCWAQYVMAEFKVALFAAWLVPCCVKLWHALMMLIN
jgi:hypothetical protein